MTDDDDDDYSYVYFEPNSLTVQINGVRRMLIEPPNDRHSCKLQPEFQQWLERECGQTFIDYRIFAVRLTFTSEDDLTKFREAWGPHVKIELTDPTRPGKS